MRKLLAVIFILIMIVPAALAEETVSAPRILVAYLSRAGENYNVGTVKEGSASAAYAGYIEKGNTAILAETIAEATGGDLFAITTVIPYPDDYATMLQVAQEEIDMDARPELAGTVENMDDYDVIFIGYPIWHGRMPQATKLASRFVSSRYECMEKLLVTSDGYTAHTYAPRSYIYVQLAAEGKDRSSLGK